jgi:hypothetical protein
LLAACGGELDRHRGHVGYVKKGELTEQLIGSSDEPLIGLDGLFRFVCRGGVVRQAGVTKVRWAGARVAGVELDPVGVDVQEVMAQTFVARIEPGTQVAIDFHRFRNYIRYMVNSLSCDSGLMRESAEAAVTVGESPAAKRRG